MTINNIAALTDSLADSDTSSFERSMRALVRAMTDMGDARESSAILAVRSISGSAIIGRRERDRRIRLVLEEFCSTDDELLRIAGEVSEIRNVVAFLLAPARRRELYLIRRHELPDREGVAYDEIDISTRQSRVAADPGSHFRTVVLLGSEQEQAQNAVRLREKNFSVLRTQSADLLANLIRDDVCGLVVGGSWWQGRSVEEQATALEAIFSYTSLLFIRIDVDGLDSNVVSDLAAIHHQCYGREPGSFTLCHGSGCSLTPADLTALSRIAGLLEAARSIQFHPDEVTEAEAHLLRVVATKVVRGANPSAASKVGHLRTEFFRGRSGAKIAIARPDDGGSPVIAKIHDPMSLREEMRKHSQFIRRWDDRLAPELHFHLDAALLLYKLVDSAAKPGRPAPTLDERLRLLANSELGSWRGADVPSEESLYLAVARAAKRLAELNKRRPTTEAASDFWLSQTLSTNMGLVWRLRGHDGRDLDLLRLIHRSARRVHLLFGKASVHGDIHPGNILLNDDREPLFIDYAECGPGHPCYDLVRLEASLWYSVFRMLDDEWRVSELIRMVILDGAEFEEVNDSFPELTHPKGNRLAIRVSSEVRRTCLEVLDLYGGALEDYLAMHVLVGAQALRMIDQQAAVARSLLRAIAQSRAWPES